jgi:imidazolonepropionase
MELRELGVIPDGSLLIRDGIIEEIGPTRRVENLAAARDAIEINAAGRVVMPGFVDSHTHLLYPPAGGANTDCESAARAVRASTGQRLQWRAQSCVAAMARHGTTTLEAKTGCGPDESAETKLMRVMAALKDNPLHIVPTFLFRLPRNTEGEGISAEAATDWVCRDLLPKIRRRRFARYVDIGWGSDPAYCEFYGRCLETARRLGFGCKVHADQINTATAIATAVQNFAVSVDHMEHAAPAEARVLAGSGTMATLLPSSGFSNGGRNAPARALIDAGVAIALATNFNPRHTPVLNMQSVIALGCLYLGLTVEEAISAATINGAHAVGRGERVGSLELGKLANLILLNISDYRELEHHFGMNLVHMTMSRGNFIYKEGDVGERPAEELNVRPGWE